MFRMVVIFLIAFPVLLGLSGFSGSQEEPSSGKDETSEVEIRKLILNLGHADFRNREKAMTRLEEIGKAALEPLYEAQKWKNAEISQRANMLVSTIEWRVLPSKTVNGMQFRLAVEKKWPVPRPGEENKINILLDIKNIGDSIYRIFPCGIHVRLTDSKGDNVLSAGGNICLCVPWYSPPLKKNQTFSIKLEGTLAQRPNNLRFRVMDSFMTCWGVENLNKGTYFITLSYRNIMEYGTDLVGPLWVGGVETFRQKVQIE